MMVSEQSRSVHAGAAPSASASASASVASSAAAASTASAVAASAFDTSTTTATSMAGGAIAFPAALANANAATVSTADVAMMDASAFAALPFDEQLMSMPAELAQQADPAAAAAAAAAIGAGFFIDTAAIAQQIAAAVSDEKKLSDNILDLIPPPQPIVSSMPDVSATTATATTTTTPATDGASLAMPLAPPPGLMDMRALSPPMSLLPDFSQSTAMPVLTLDAAALAVASAVTVTAPPATTTTTAPVAAPTTVAPPAPATIAAPVSTTTTAVAAAAAAAAAAALSAAPTAEDRRKVAYAAASVLKKRKSADAFASDGAAVSSGALPTTSYIAASTAASSISTPTPSTIVPPSTAATTIPTSTSNIPTVSAATAANLQNLAREKVMKEPQSGDLYECVITKRNGGLGLTLACVDDHVQITGLAPDTPAANSGICVGDTLVAVSGLPVRGLQFSTVIGRLKSSSRNSVVLKLRRNPFRHNANGNGLPYRNNNGVGVGLKRPARPLSKTPESNSANVLSNTKSMALETRLAGPSGAGSTASSGNGDPNATSTAFHVKTEPTQSAYFQTDAVTLTAMGLSATTPMPTWRVAEEDRDRYYAECRRLRQELSHAVSWRRRERSAAEALHHQFQEIAHKFESEMQTIFQIGAAAASGAATTDSSSVAKSHHEDLVALRQKLLEVNHALARQQTEILELKERDARHAFHEMRRIKAEVVHCMQKRMQEMVMTGASQLKAPGEPFSKPCEERVEGVRASVFELLFQQSSSASVASKLLASRHHHHHHHRSGALASSNVSGMLSVKQEKNASIELDLDMAQAAQVLAWNLREHLPARSLVTQVVGGLKVEYVTHEEVLTLRFQLQLVEEKP